MRSVDITGSPRTLTFDSGRMEPSLSRRVLSEQTRKVADAAHRAGKQVVLLARGGKFARSTFAVKSKFGGRITFRDAVGKVKHLEPHDKYLLVNDRELASALAKDSRCVVLAIGATGTELARIDQGIIMLPYLGFDYATVLPHVD